MSRSNLVSPRSALPLHAASRSATGWQRFLRARVLKRLAGLQSGALAISDSSGAATVGNLDGALGVHDLEIHDLSFFSALAASGAVGAGEAYVAGKWDTDDLVSVLRLMVRDRDVLLDVDRSLWSLPRRLLLRLGYWQRRNSREGSRQNIADHYDLSDDLFALFLDPSMTYSSAWFEYPNQSLAAAQAEKLRRLCLLVDLTPGDKLLEIGTGWGSLAIAAAGTFGAHVTTTTISSNQFQMASDRVHAASLGHRVELLQKDYRDVEGTFDKLISCEMIEAVGARYLPEFLRCCAARLKPGGILGLQAITIADQHYETALKSVDYIKRHVFPGSFIPSVTAITKAASEHTDLRLVKMEDFGLHYAETLNRWRQTWLARREQVAALGGNDSFLRAWDFYFAYCEAGFRERHIGVCHLRFERTGTK
ncbi:MAG: cyclopropane-fatty-acyl-phospholipid synthase [Planctomycetota bacterium]|jgi:cyclopropane-fatty-acyl-phospholipid synthase